MANNTSPADIISTPKGGGAISGIGEKFSPELFTGTGNFTIPVPVPTGRNDFQPELNLVYSTGNGNGPFGLGWNLSVPGVSRKTSKGVPVYNNEKDTLLLSGSEDLVAVGTSAERTRYQPRTEGLFSEITHHHNGDNDYWKVRSKDGLTSIYGTPGTVGEDAALVSDPDDRSKIHSWSLTETIDSFGNRIVYEYDRDAGQDEPHQWDQLYLKRIRYVEYQAEALTKFLASVTFHYETRPDPFSQYKPGFEIRTRRRCTRIETHINADEERRIRILHLHYQNQPLNGSSLLSGIAVTGHNKDGKEELPPLKFDYTAFTPEKRHFSPVRGDHLPASSLNNPSLEMADLTGNGMPDILEMNGTVRYWRNLGDGRFAPPRRMKNAPAGHLLTEPGVQLIDADGNGRIDLMVHKNNQSGYYPLQPDGQWDKDSFRRYQQTPGINLQSPEVQMVDLDGDGITDAVRSGSSFECFFNDPQDGWIKHRRIPRRRMEEFPDVSFSDSRVRWADMTGDGLKDILLLHNGRVDYWPNLGHGNWGNRITMKHNPRFPYGYNPEHILIGDVDGDGMADLIYVDHDKVHLWINQSGNAWIQDPITITGTPEMTDMDDIRLIDLNGNGTSGLLWSSAATSTSQDHMYFLDFTGGVKPYLLDTMDNNMGAVTKVQYASSSRFYNEDHKKPETRWKTTLPFPVQVVSGVEVIDQISGSKHTTRYRYHHGYWDGDEREFRGFGMVEQFDTELFEDYNSQGLHGQELEFNKVGDEDPEQFSPQTLKKTWFHQGPVRDEQGEWSETDYSKEFWSEDPSMLKRPERVAKFLKELSRRDQRDALRTLRGRVLRTEFYAQDGTDRESRPYTVTESLQGIREESPPGEDDADRQRIFFPHMLSKRTTQWERGNDPMTRFSFTGDYDEFGQSRRQTKIACPRNWRKPEDTADEPFLATRSTKTYARSPDDPVRIADRVAQSTTFEINNDGSQTVMELKELSNDDPALQVTGQKLKYYDGKAFEGLPSGHIGKYGALVRSESLVLTDAILQEAYPEKSSPPNGKGRPPYLVPGSSDWSAEYPEEFQERLSGRAGYIHRKASESVQGYFSVTKQCKYDFQEEDNPIVRGILKSTRDPLGNETNIDYDAFGLLPVSVVNPAGLITKARYDYHTMKPAEVTDANGNRKTFTYTPLGRLAGKGVMGKKDESTGDSNEVPGTTMQYDLKAFADRGKPVSVRSIERVYHVNDSGVSGPEKGEIITTIEYSDGFGRLLQTRTQGEEVRFGDTSFGGKVIPTDQEDTENTRKEIAGALNNDPDQPNVIVSGWKRYNNKGKVVEQYEPFFSVGWNYRPPGKSSFGQKIKKYYDPRGEIVRSVQPDSAELRMIRGIPDTLTDPEKFSPSPWETFTYDTNDNAGRTHPEKAGPYKHHWDTPSSSTTDALGRTIETIERNRLLPDDDDGERPSIEEIRTRSTYDIRGNLLTQTDAMGRKAFRYVFDLADNPVRKESIDAGTCRFVLDAAGQEVERRDSKNAFVLHAYDQLGRPVRKWARDGKDDNGVTLRERLVYGDSEEAALSDEEALEGSLLGKPYKHYDEAGLTAIDRYDFKGNIVNKIRRIFSDATIIDAATNDTASSGRLESFVVNWQPPEGRSLDTYAGDLLDEKSYGTTLDYDALNRVTKMMYPEDAEGGRKALVSHYNRAGALQQVTLGDNVFVEHIAYDAKGQRTLMALGNGIMTRYGYDPATFRLARLRTEHYEKTGDHAYKPRKAPLQDLAYRYDLAGNIIKILDQTPDSGIPGSIQGADSLDRNFTYDPLYQLISATGRECDQPGSEKPWSDQPRCNDPNKTRAYTQKYSYDPTGNMMMLRHVANGGRFTRHLDMADDNNRLDKLKVGSRSSERVYEYTYDKRGNLIRENTERHITWDHSNQLKVFKIQPDDAEPSLQAIYLYDASGHRVKKLIRKQGGQVESTVYVGDMFEHHRWDKNSSGAGENIRYHIMDDQRRIALLRAGDRHPDDPRPALQYHLGDHLGSSNLVVNGEGGFINREEYSPYGETSFGSYARKRYRYTGKERDEESGLYYHGARYYAPWTGRWVSCDPAGEADGINLYRYVRNNPLKLADSTGMQSEKPEPGSRENPIQVHSMEKVPDFAREKINSGEWEGWYSAPPGSGVDGSAVQDVAEAEEVEFYGGHFYTYTPVETIYKTQYYHRGDSYYIKGAEESDWRSVGELGYYSSRKVSRMFANSSPEDIRYWNGMLDTLNEGIEDALTIETLLFGGIMGFATLGTGAAVGASDLFMTAKGFYMSGQIIGSTSALIGGTAKLTTTSIKAFTGDPSGRLNEIDQGVSNVVSIASGGGPLGFFTAAAAGKDPMKGAQIGSGLFSLGSGLYSLGSGPSSLGSSVENLSKREYSGATAGLISGIINLLTANNP